MGLFRFAKGSCNFDVEGLINRQADWLKDIGTIDGRYGSGEVGDIKIVGELRCIELVVLGSDSERYLPALTGCARGSIVFAIRCTEDSPRKREDQRPDGERMGRHRIGDFDGYKRLRQR